MTMSKDYLDSLNPSASYIFICTSPISMPLSFFLHTYIITHHAGVTHRYEVDWCGSPEAKAASQYIHKDLLHPWEGCHVFVKKYQQDPGKRWPVDILHTIDSETDPYVTHTIQTIEEVYQTYPAAHTYRLIGPNSNTYTQWLLTTVGIQVRLPLLAWGRSYTFTASTT